MIVGQRRRHPLALRTRWIRNAAAIAPRLARSPAMSATPAACPPAGRAGSSVGSDFEQHQQRRSRRRWRRRLRPRTSSARSGFFLFGIRLDPVASESGQRTKPNSAADQSTSSSASARQMHRAQAAGEGELDREIAVAHRIEAVVGDGRETELGGERAADRCRRRAPDRGAAERQDVGPTSCRFDPLDDRAAAARSDASSQCASRTGWARWKCV